MLVPKYRRDNRVIRILVIFTCLSTIIFVMLYVNASNNRVTAITTRPIDKPRIQSNLQPQRSPPFSTTTKRVPVKLERFSEHEFKMRIMREKVERLTKRLNPEPATAVAIKIAKSSTKNVHIFYATHIKWYKQRESSNVERIGSQHADHGTLNTVFYPASGPYRTDENVLRKHFKSIRQLGIGVVILTWTNEFSHHLLNVSLNVAHLNNISVCIEMDSYDGRSIGTIRQDLKYLYEHFVRHPAFYKVFLHAKGVFLPMFYVKDPIEIDDKNWRTLLTKRGENTIRKTELDAVFIGHAGIEYVGEVKSKMHSQFTRSKENTNFVRRSGFNGFYPRVPSNGATYSSTWKNWMSLKKFADKYKMIFIPTVGPGYAENKKQPKTGSLRRHRTNGQYYGVAWRTAMTTSAQFISLHSFNDWISGTQIEEAITVNGFKDYQPGTPTKYLDMTRQWLHELTRTREENKPESCQAFFNNTFC